MSQSAGKQGQLAAAWNDLAGGVGEYWIWGSLAVRDVLTRHQGSYLGPFWITLSTAVMVAALTIIFSGAFRVGVSSYVPYLAIGMVLWQFLSGMVLESCTTFLSADMIGLVPMRRSIHVYRLVSRNLMIACYNAIALVVLLAWFDVPVTARLLELFPALLLYALNGIWLSVILGMLCVRFRDASPIVASILQVGFFVTPVFWPIETVGKWRHLAELNPFFAAIDIVRSPLLNAATAPTSWTIMIAVTAAGSAAGFFALAAWRNQIVYWV